MTAVGVSVPLSVLPSRSGLENYAGGDAVVGWPAGWFLDWPGTHFRRAAGGRTARVARVAQLPTETAGAKVDPR